MHWGNSAWHLVAFLARLAGVNITLRYLYRDASNYKRWGKATFSNRGRLSTKIVLRRFLEAAEPWQVFGDIHSFRPELVGLPTLYFTDIGYEENEDDHSFHELDEVLETNDPPTDPRSILEFLLDLHRAAKAWREGSGCPYTWA